MTCQDPAKCGTGIKQGQQLKLTFVYSTGQAAVTAMWQTYKSDASKAGIDINLVGQTFNTIVGEAAPCAPMGPKCNVQVFAYGGWVFDGPGFEPTGEPLFATGAGSNAGNYSDPKMDNLINATHTSSSLAVFHDYATYGAQQLPFIWNPNAVHGPGDQQQTARRDVQPAVHPAPRVLVLHQVAATAPGGCLPSRPGLAALRP